MFTGLIQQKASLLKMEKSSDGLTISLSRPLDFDNLKKGESIAVDGACLTLVNFDSVTMNFFVGPETLKKTTLADLCRNQEVNLERSLSLGDRLGGHMVTGHVDGIGKVMKREETSACLGLQIQVTREHFRWMVPKGSICLNGVSLTINNVWSDQETFWIEVLLIPETLERTNLKRLEVGSSVNVECDQTVKIIAHQFQNMVKMMSDPSGPLKGIV